MKRFNIGDYVRTTYGIGKIIKAYVVYSDDGCIWHLSYMTSNPKIEIGIYTKENSYKLFGQVQKNHRIKYEPLMPKTSKYFDMVYGEELDDPVCYVPVNKGIPRNAELFDDHKVVKVSKKLEDLIAPFDLVELRKTNKNASFFMRPKTYEEVEKIKRKLKTDTILVSVMTSENYKDNACKRI